MKKLRVLAFVDYYLPGYKGGGPIASVSRIAESLGDTVEFFVYTRDRDLGDEAPYPGLSDEAWVHSGNAQVHYVDPARISARSVLQAVRACRPDVVYLNSFFSKMTVLVLALRRLGLLHGVGVVLAPRGEFSPGALQIKSAKKRAFCAFARATGLYNGIVWKPSTPREQGEIRDVFPEAHCVVLPEIATAPSEHPRPEKSRGSCRFVFVSRVSPKKNLEFALRLLVKAQGDVSLDVYGPFESDAYERGLRKTASVLPANVTVRFLGPIEPKDVPASLSSCHFFLFPTLGENFGHVIAESLAVGLPCVLSDTTPWSDIEPAGAGWALPLEDEALWNRRLAECIEMDSEAYGARCQAARTYYKQWRGGHSGADSDQIFQLGADAA